MIWTCVTLERGTRLRLGEQVVVKIIVPRTGCVKLHRIDARMPDDVKDRVGVMAEVVQGGWIKVGDAVEVLREA